MTENNGKHALQTLLEDIKSDRGDDNMDIRSYSGRGMYAKECLAVAGVRLSQLLSDVISAVGNQVRDTENVDAIAEAFEDMKTDNMGRNIVVYFPNVPFVEGSDAAEELDQKTEAPKKGTPPAEFFIVIDMMEDDDEVEDNSGGGGATGMFLAAAASAGLTVKSLPSPNCNPEFKVTGNKHALKAFLRHVYGDDEMGKDMAKDKLDTAEPA